MAIVLFNFNAVIGLFIGSLVTTHGLPLDTKPMVIVSVISAVTPYIAFLFTRCCLKVQLTLRGLTTQQLLMMCVVYATCNAILHNLYFYYTGITQEFSISTLNMFIGDLLGALLMFYAFSLAIKLIKRLH